MLNHLYHFLSYLKFELIFHFHFLFLHNFFHFFFIFSFFSKFSSSTLFTSSTVLISLQNRELLNIKQENDNLSKEYKDLKEEHNQAIITNQQQEYKLHNYNTEKS